MLDTRPIAQVWISSYGKVRTRYGGGIRHQGSGTAKVKFQNRRACNFTVDYRMFRPGDRPTVYGGAQLSKRKGACEFTPLKNPKRGSLELLPRNRENGVTLQKISNVAFIESGCR